MFRVYLSHTGH